MHVHVIVLRSWGGRFGIALCRRTSHARFVFSYVQWTYSWQAQNATSMILQAKSPFILCSTTHIVIIFSCLLVFIFNIHSLYQTFANSMRKLRRAGKIGEFVSIFVNEKQVSLYPFESKLIYTRTQHPDVDLAVSCISTLILNLKISTCFTLYLFWSSCSQNVLEISHVLISYEKV